MKTSTIIIIVSLVALLSLGAYFVLGKKDDDGLTVNGIQSLPPGSVRPSLSTAKIDGVSFGSWVNTRFTSTMPGESASEPVAIMLSQMERNETWLTDLQGQADLNLMPFDEFAARQAVEILLRNGRIKVKAGYGDEIITNGHNALFYQQQSPNESGNVGSTPGGGIQLVQTSGR